MRLTSIRSIRQWVVAGLCVACAPQLSAQTPERVGFGKSSSRRSVPTRMAAFRVQENAPLTLEQRDEAASPSDLPQDDSPSPTTSLPGTSQYGQAATRGDSLAPIQNRPLSNVVAAVNTDESKIGTGILPDSAVGRLPDAVILPDGAARGATFKCVHWRPAAICHYPLYFEDAMLERHGHVRFPCAQPAISGVKFLGSMVLLPYLHTLQPCYKSKYALGHYRAGTTAPCLMDTVPWDKRAATVEALSVAGFFWAMPL